MNAWRDSVIETVRTGTWSGVFADGGLGCSGPIDDDYLELPIPDLSDSSVAIAHSAVVDACEDVEYHGVKEGSDRLIVEVSGGSGSDAGHYDVDVVFYPMR